MKRQRRKYENPTEPFDKQRIEKEKQTLKEFGLTKKKELWRAQGLLRKYRRLARELAASRDEGKENILVDKLVKVGVLDKGASLDDVLGLTVEKFLERRLVTLIFKKGLSGSITQARQFVTHGHVLINDRKIFYPSYLVPKDEEEKIQVSVSHQQKKVDAANVTSG